MPLDAESFREPEDGKEALDCQSSFGTESKPDLPLSIFGLPIGRWLPSQNLQFVFLAVSALGFSAMWAAMQEKALHVPGFKFTGWMSFLTSCTCVVCASIERRSQGLLERKARILDYAKLSLLTASGMYFTNWSLQYLSYPLRVMAKSSKLLPTIFLSIVYVKRKFSTAQICSVLVLSVGISAFTLGDARSGGKFDVTGIPLIVIGLLCDAFSSNYEEKYFFAGLSCSSSEILLYISIFGCGWTLIAIIAEGQLQSAVLHSAENPEVVWLIVASAAANYCATSCVLLLVKFFGATVCEIVKTLRKVLTICLSFVFFEKQIMPLHIVGGFFLLASVAVERQAWKLKRGLLTSAFGLGCFVILLLVVLQHHPTSGPGTLPLSSVPDLVPTTIDATTSFTIVFDAGSSGTRVHVFRFNRATSKVEAIDGKPEVFKKTQPGISSFAENHEKLPGHFAPLINAALAVVPKNLRAVTPLALRATAGLRMLPSTQAEELLTEVRKIFSPHGFKDAGIYIMDGSEEGECQWVAVNYLMGAFQQTSGDTADSTVAVADLGGGSLQMAYSVGQEVDILPSLSKYVSNIQLPLGRGAGQLYMHSYLGYGLNAVRKKFIEIYGPVTATMSVIDGLLQPRLPCGIAGFQKAGRDVGQCTFAGAWAPPMPITKTMVLCSFFFDRMQDAGAIPEGAIEATVTTEDFGVAAEKACSSKTNAGEPLSLKSPSSDWLCFDLTYMAALLQKGFNLDTKRQVKLVKQIPVPGLGDFEATWALGVSLKYL